MPVGPCGERLNFKEQVGRIELPCSAWKADTRPLCHTCEMERVMGLEPTVSTLERVTGLEPVASCLASRRSTN